MYLKKNFQQTNIECFLTKQIEKEIETIKRQKNGFLKIIFRKKKFMHNNYEKSNIYRISV